MADERLTDATLKLVRLIEEKFNQTEKTATITLGVLVGIVASTCLISCMITSRHLYKTQNNRVTGSADTCCVTNEHCEVFEQPVSVSLAEGDGETANVSSAAGTEGAYRSDSDSDDEGQGAKLCEEAQRRSRMSNCV